MAACDQLSTMMTDEELQRIYQWVDEVPLSRPKRNIARDFADGVLSAEIVSHYFPRMVEVHNYPAANSYAQKVYNWCACVDAVIRTRTRRAHAAARIAWCRPFAARPMRPVASAACACPCLAERVPLSRCRCVDCRNTLNAKVFKKMGFQLNKEEVEAIVGCTPQAVERMLLKLQQQMASYGARQQAEPAPAPTGSKPYKPPPKPEPRAATVPRAPGAAC